MIIEQSQDSYFHKNEHKFQDNEIWNENKIHKERK